MAALDIANDPFAGVLGSGRGQPMPHTARGNFGHHRPALERLLAAAAAADPAQATEWKASARAVSDPGEAAAVVEDAGEWPLMASMREAVEELAGKQAHFGAYMALVHAGYAIIASAGLSAGTYAALTAPAIAWLGEEALASD